MPKADMVVAAALTAIIEMSDNTEKQASIFDKQIFILKMQESIQANKKRMLPFLKEILQKDGK